MLHYFGIYEIERPPFRKCLNVTGKTVEEVKRKYENFVEKNHAYIIDLYPMDNKENRNLYGALSSISITI